MLVLIASVLPLASTQIQMEREEELIFRGRQYAEAIRVFRKRYGRYPNSLAEMHEVRPRTLRKKWKDPIRNTEEWGLITVTNAAQAGSVPVAPANVPNMGPGGGGLGERRSGGSGFGGSGGTQPTPVPTKEVDPFPTPSFGGPARSGGVEQAAAGPVMGVYSLSSKKALRLYEGREVYSEWKFTEQTLAQSGSPDLGGPVVPGPGGPRGNFGNPGVSPPGGGVKR